MIFQQTFLCPCTCLAPTSHPSYRGAHHSGNASRRACHGLFKMERPTQGEFVFWKSTPVSRIIPLRCCRKTDTREEDPRKKEVTAPFRLQGRKNRSCRLKSHHCLRGAV